MTKSPASGPELPRDMTIFRPKRHQSFREKSPANQILILSSSRSKRCDRSRMIGSRTDPGVYPKDRLSHPSSFHHNVPTFDDGGDYCGAPKLHRSKIPQVRSGWWLSINDVNISIN